MKKVNYKRVRSGYLKKLILCFLLAILSLNITGCSNNITTLKDKSNCIHKAWYKKTPLCTNLKKH